jgi:hypothetical protein
MVCATSFVLLASLQKPSQGTPASEESCLLPGILLVLVDVLESVLALDEDDDVVTSLRLAVGDKEEDDDVVECVQSAVVDDDDNDYDDEGDDDDDHEVVRVEIDD